MSEVGDHAIGQAQGPSRWISGWVEAYLGSPQEGLRLILEGFEHNRRLGARYTRRLGRLPVTLVWFEQDDRIEDAFAREKQVQGWSRAKRIALIEAEDPFTHERARLVVHILEELGGADKPHGRLTDQASLSTGDFDGDGIEDLALGVPESDLGKPSGGAVFVFKGSADGLPKQPTWTLTGESDTANLGAVLAAGDLDGDGRAELAISEPGADITVADSGAVSRPASSSSR